MRYVRAAPVVAGRGPALGGPVGVGGPQDGPPLRGGGGGVRAHPPRRRGPARRRADGGGLRGGPSPPPRRPREGVGHPQGQPRPAEGVAGRGRPHRGEGPRLADARWDPGPRAHAAPLRAGGAGRRAARRARRRCGWPTGSREFSCPPARWPRAWHAAPASKGASVPRSRSLAPVLAALRAQPRVHLHQLGGFNAFAFNLGALHCIKKYLAR